MTLIGGLGKFGSILAIYKNTGSVSDIVGQAIAASNRIDAAIVHDDVSDLG